MTSTSYHTHHLTPLAKFALRIPGVWAWALVLHLHLATSRCRGECARRTA